MTVDAVVIGAGVAGLAATRRLREAGRSVQLVEAGPRLGGRASTTRIGIDPFDLGASWLHDAERNPLVGLADAADGLRASSDREERVFVAGRRADAAETRAYHAAWDRLDEVVAPAMDGPDVSLAAAMAPMAGDPWAGLVALWEGAIIAAADADVLGLRDWHRNRLEGTNMVARRGIGAFVVRHLGTAAELETPARRVVWSGRGVRVETPRGTIEAAAAIVTVSTGVLAAGDIGFEPELPVELQESLHRLPMGLLSKVAFPARGEDRFGVPEGALLVAQAGRMTFNAWHQGRAHITGFMGGRQAWEVAWDAGAAEARAREELGAMLGEAAVRRLGPAAVVTDWGTNPLFRGAYAYAGPGNSEARDDLARWFPGDRLLFAGEAVRVDGLAGTVAGAYLSGIEAAERLLTLRAPNGTD